MKVSELTEDQIDKLADAVISTSRSAFRQAESMFGVVITKDGDFLLDRLREEGGVFECSDCGTWLGTDEQDYDDDAEICTDCGDERRADERRADETSDLESDV